MARKAKTNKIPFLEVIRLCSRGYRMWFKEYPMMVFSSVISAVVGSLAPYVGIYLSAQIINEIAGSRYASVLTRLVLIALISAVVISMLNAGLSRWKNYEYAGQRHKWNKIYTEKLLSMDFCDIDSSRTHNLIAQIRQNENFGWGFAMLMRGFDALVSSLTTIIGAVALITTLFTSTVPETAGRLVVLNSPLFILPIIAVMISVTLIVPLLSNKANSYWSNFFENVGMSVKYELFFGKSAQNRTRALDIRTYRQDFISKKYLEESLHFADNAKKTVAPMRTLNSAATAVGYVFTAVIYIFVCLKAWGGAFGVGSVTQYIGAVTAMSGGLSGLFRFWGDMHNNSPFLRTLFEFIDIPNAMHKGNHPLKLERDDKYEIEFRNVSFKYPSSEEYVLKNLSFKFNTGQRIAVVGQNGSGKTTFIKLLCRLHDPTEGEIYLNGVDIREYDYKQYLGAFSVVFQDFKLLSFTIGQNISAAANYDAAKAGNCLDKAGFGERMLTLSKGLDTSLYKDFENDGVEISGGEAQKIALARALYKDSPFVILDEPTAALDPIAEFEIYVRMYEIVGDKSVIFISHRLSSCRFCNDIVVFHEGRIVQRGSHDDLVTDQSGMYSVLWNAQAQYYTSNE